MTGFEIRECSNQDCRLRLPLDPSEYSGEYCPCCGEPMRKVLGPFENPQCPSLEVKPERKIAVLIDNIRSAFNVGAIFRTADGAGLKHLYLCGITPTPLDQNAIQKTALGAEETIPWSYHPNAVLLAEKLRNEGFLIVGLECTPHAVPIHQAQVLSTKDQPLLLVVGNERAGIDPGLQDLCDLILALPMVGEKASLNAAVAFGIAAYWLSFR